VLQPLAVIEEDSEEVLATEAVEVADVDAAEAVAEVAEVVARRKRTGSL
jgi:ribosomal protein L32E